MDGQFSVQNIINQTFELKKFLDPRISEQIEGIVEYSVQELSDEDMLMLEMDYNITHETQEEEK